MDILKNTIAGILAGIVLAALGYFLGEATGKSEGIIMGYEEAKSTYVKQVKSAPEVYVEELEKVIRTASKSPDIIVDARAIVSARNDLRRSLTSISSSLNSEIDRLSTEVKKAKDQAMLGPGASRYTEDIERTIKVIDKKWPSKKAQIEVEVRKLIAELGLEKIPDRPNN